MRKAQLRRALAVTTVAACLATTLTAFSASTATAAPDAGTAAVAPDKKGPGKPGKPAPGKPGKPGKPKPGKPTPTPSAPAGDHDTTSAVEAARVDGVPTPDPDWYDCSSYFGDGAECGVVALPLDYDEPDGATTEVALLRIKATDPDKRIGSLFINPGGPGGSGVDIASFAPYFLSPEVLATFDVVGLDPRGTNYSDNVRCFKNIGQQDAALSGMYVPYPQGEEQTAAFVDSARKLGQACSTTGKPLSASMSTAQVARDMDVVRRAVGDEELTYLGFSYGSYLGQVYANMFPDRVRALVIDGVLDPLAWAGTEDNADIPVTERLGSGTAAWRAAQEVLTRCAEAGPELCRTAEIGEPQAVWDEVYAGLDETPVELRDPYTDELLVEVDTPVFVNAVLGALYSPSGWSGVDLYTWAFYWLLQPETPENAALRAEALEILVGYERQEQEKAAARDAQRVERAAGRGFAFPYSNYTEAFSAVLCTDSLNPAQPEEWIVAGERQDELAPGFGPAWSWASPQCASSVWTAQDEDAWRGPFTARTAAPVLVVGNLWDPATAYEGAVAAADVLPNSRLLSSDNWGHTAYGTSVCATGAIDAYLIAGELPAVGTQCVGDEQPFVVQPSSRTAEPKRALPPVVPPVPGATPRS
ncbi:TAP domain protein [Cellulomonas flavigena DSM 20109]|uniref:TAP domain protein n=1 Tax=Cellulomonas flavigena (strain ATCC 482 / DSM 20109 / BCRC 11376 / JCM 18109 / NBRC 3775 / NCIMB 8073 / NRS 134) TaxID=446466 RepID=D5UJ07_CELFN|nr:alpha/beta hydrolase [Cellulomonas flavigena]ADG75573.1 TAP domain protein [Cellulomonas flavigena DSM 20109]